VKNVREILPEVYRQGADKNSSDQELALAYWPVVVGETIAQRTRPVVLLGKRLVVDVESLVWRRQLAGLSRTIASKLNRAIGRPIVEGIDFRVAAPSVKPMGRAASAAGLESNEDDAAGIADGGLRRLYRLSKKRLAK
jgi:predicted nucleic acid-binding Zn ribbon protein